MIVIPNGKKVQKAPSHAIGDLVILVRPNAACVPARARLLLSERQSLTSKASDLVKACASMATRLDADLVQLLS